MAVRWRSVHRVGESPRHRRARLLIASALLPPLSIPAIADPDPPPVSREIWAGADVSSNVWLAYSGVTIAPWGGIYDNGWRFRAAGGYGEYAYRPVREDVDNQVRNYYADFLVGYLQRFGELTAKAFVGPSLISHNPIRDDTMTVLIGEEVGVKGVLELWLNIGDRGWGSLDLSWSSAHDTRAARARVGYRVWPKLSLGLEAGLNVDAQGECRLGMANASDCKSDSDNPVEPADLMDYARGGAFARYEWDRGELSVSAGLLGDSFGSHGDTELAPYVTVNWLTQF